MNNLQFGILSLVLAIGGFVGVYFTGNTFVGGLFAIAFLTGFAGFGVLFIDWLFFVVFLPLWDYARKRSVQQSEASS